MGFTSQATKGLTMLLWTKQVLFTKHVMMLLQFLFAQGINVSLGECFRTEIQAEWNAEHHIGITHSLHCKRLAVDLIFHDMSGRFLKDKAAYESAGKYWESLHPDNKWGGSFRHGCVGDYGHFQMNDEEVKNFNGIKQ